jgi:transglutaminase-like putative cysteine protease
MRRYTVVHRTQYDYSSPMQDGFTLTTLRPRSTSQQSIVDHSMHVDPSPDERADFEDIFGNHVTRFAVHRAHSSLVVEARSVVDVVTLQASAPRPVSSVSSTSLAAVAALARSACAAGPDADSVDPVRAEFCAPTASVPHSPVVRAGAMDLWRGSGLDVDRWFGDVAFDTGMSGELNRAGADDIDALDAVTALTRTIFERFTFDPGFTDVTTPIDEVVVAQRGVCQDFAHVALACLRGIGLPARYVSGYLETIPPPGQARLIGADASHAWVSVWLGPLGWVDLDPTNNQVPPQRHVTVGWGRDYSDLAPVRGVVIGPSGVQDLTVAVDVQSTPIPAGVADAAGAVSMS